MIETKDGILLKANLEGSRTGLRGMMKKDWKDQDLDLLIKEAKNPFQIRGDLT